MVFVLDKHKKPLMPCTPKRARLLLSRGKAIVHKMIPFTIRLTERLVGKSELQPVTLKFDPGSQTTSIALAREESTTEGAKHHALHLAHLEHKGAWIADCMKKRSDRRRRRRSTNLRYRAPRFRHRTRPSGWLTPSMRSRVDNIWNWAKRYSHLAPITKTELEFNKFDTQLMQNATVSGLGYQQGTLAGYEIRQYVLEKWGRSCQYCDAANVPLQLDHIVPKSRFGSNRPSNLIPACECCNQKKGKLSIQEFLVHNPKRLERILDEMKDPLRDAAAMNITRWAVLNGLEDLGFSVRCWSGGRTHWNRTRFGLPKTHSWDALCVGKITGVSCANLPVLNIKATGRGQRQRQNVDKYGFPKGKPALRKKTFMGFQTGDLVRANIPTGKYKGTHVGRVAIRFRPDFKLNGFSVHPKYLKIIQRGDGYGYATILPHA